MGISRLKKGVQTILDNGQRYWGLDSRPTLAVILAENGFNVTGFDKNKALVNKLKDKVIPFYEDGLENLIHAHVNNSLNPTYCPDEILADIYIITVGTPILPQTKKPDTDYIENAVKVIAKKLKLNDLVILRSTVPVGCTREIVIPILEQISGLKVGTEFLFHIALKELLREGSTELRELPQIVGGFDHTSAHQVLEFFNENTHTVIDVGSLESAEMCKLLDNTYRDAMFGYANQMATFAKNWD